MPFGPLHPSLLNTSSPWYLSCQQEKVTTLFFSPPVLPSCPSPNLSSCLTLILTHGFGPGNRGSGKRDRASLEWAGGLEAWVKQNSGIFLLHCERPSTWLVFNFHGFRIEAVQSSGYTLDLQGPLTVPCVTQKPWGGWELGVGREAGRDRGVQWSGLGLLWLPLSLSTLFTLCFVLSGPRLHPQQKESRRPMKVSLWLFNGSPLSQWGAWISPIPPFSDLGVGRRNMSLEITRVLLGLTLVFLKVSPVQLSARNRTCCFF